MKLHSLKIEGFRRIQKAEIMFGDATFLIGANNAGKSSVLRAIEYLLSDSKILDQKDFYSVLSEDGNENVIISKKIVFEAEFRNVAVESETWRGFKGRIFKYKPNAVGDTGISIPAISMWMNACKFLICF